MDYEFFILVYLCIFNKVLATLNLYGTLPKSLKNKYKKPLSKNQMIYHKYHL
jgi:hypothetical protein